MRARILWTKPDAVSRRCVPAAVRKFSFASVAMAVCIAPSSLDSRSLALNFALCVEFGKFAPKDGGDAVLPVGIEQDELCRGGELSGFLLACWFFVVSGEDECSFK